MIQLPAGPARRFLPLLWGRPRQGGTARRLTSGEKNRHATERAHSACCVAQPYFTTIKHKQFTGLKIKAFYQKSLKTSLQNINIFLNVSLQWAIDGKTSEHSIVTDTKREEAANNSHGMCDCASSCTKVLPEKPAARPLCKHLTLRWLWGPQMF